MKCEVFVNNNNEILIVRDNNDNISCFTSPNKAPTTDYWSNIDNLKSQGNLRWIQTLKTSYKNTFSKEWFNINIYK